MAAAARRRPARSPARAVLSAAVVLVVAGCSTPAVEPEPEFAGGSEGAGTDSVRRSPAPSTAPGEEAPALPLPDLTYDGDAATGLGVPWSVVVLDDGALVVSDRETGAIHSVPGGSGGPEGADRGAAQLIGTVEEAAAASGEGGLLGLAVQDTGAPDALYAYYTAAADNRVVRIPWTADGLGRPEPILTGIPKANIHNGGRLAFGPDGHLYVGTGDAGTRSDAQDPRELAGKILRITADGGVPADNPTAGSPVYSVGHRNVQGLAWDSTGRLWATEFGPEVDELNLVEPGGNYGWPAVTGTPADPRFIDAQVVWPSTASSSPSGMAILDDVAYIGGLRGQRLWQVPLTGGTAGRPVSHFEGSYGRLRDVVAGPGGSLLVATNESGGARILRVALG